MTDVRIEEIVGGPYPAFANRTGAGRSLVAFLALGPDPKLLVLGLPRGGIPVARPIADALDAELRPVLVRKLPLPQSPEMGFGAVTIDGTVVLNDQIVNLWRLDDRTVQEVTEEVRREVERRSHAYPGGHPLPDMSGRTVLLVDDGLATGFSMVAAARMVRGRGAERVAVAIPASPVMSLRTLEPEVDEITCLIAQEGGGPFAVASFYRDFRDLSDEEVRDLLR